MCSAEKLRCHEEFWVDLIRKGVKVTVREHDSIWKIQLDFQLPDYNIGFFYDIHLYNQPMIDKLHEKPETLFELVEHDLAAMTGE